MQKRADKRTSRKQARKQRKSNRITNVILVICLGVFIFASYKLIQIFLEYKAGSDEYAGLTQYAPTVTLQQTDTATETTAAGEITTADSWVKPDTSLPLMDFSDLEAINGDVKAWLTIFDTHINYPVVQTDDDETYLHRTFEGKSNASGCLFISQYNTGFDDSNTVIYGHNMKNGSMFHDLVNFKDEEFFQKHRYGVLYTPEKTYWLDIFAAYVVPADGGFDQVLFSSDEEEAAYFEKLLERAPQQLGYTADGLAPILTLSTCTYEYNDARFVVHARIME